MGVDVCSQRRVAWCGRKCVVDLEAGVVMGWSFAYVSVKWAVVGEIV